MSGANLVLKSFTWAVSIISLFVILLCAGLVSLIVGDWIVIKTSNDVLAWGVGFFIFFGFLCSMGTGIGIWMWLKGPTSYQPDSRVEEDTMTKILADITSSERE